MFKLTVTLLCFASAMAQDLDAMLLDIYGPDMTVNMIYKNSEEARDMNAEMPSNPEEESVNVEMPPNPEERVNTELPSNPEEAIEAVNTELPSNPEEAIEAVNTEVPSNPEEAADVVNTEVPSNPEETVDVVNTEVPQIAEERVKRQAPSKDDNSCDLGTTKGRCVPYYLCNGNLTGISLDQASSCPGTIDVCCPPSD
ncbi:thioredoxin domain-containing protein 2-like [Ostrinia furnacalis]|uniref:thioredoxin domain-containing protein 2-like n=1 Tax=Ostrinia furnacalis TaxID=93504 RepID=UPI001039433A|nr:thioredoxin domain-containing protein 2-like [Ostrinia furnacalis]